MTKTIVVYSQHGCMFCDQAKEYLSQKGIKFQERDIAQDPGALADLKQTGYCDHTGERRSDCWL